jgi:hypothetical protein
MVMRFTDGTNPLEPCDAIERTCYHSTICSVLSRGDCDGDELNNGVEIGPLNKSS